MIGSGIDTQMAAHQANSKDLVRFKQEMDGLKQRLAGDADANKEKEMRKAAQDFEAVFISKIWQGMKSTVPKEGYLHSKQEEQYMSMFDREFAEKMARAGGIGLADMIYDQLSEKLKETSKTTLAGGVQVKPLVAQPIALDQGKDAIPLSKDPGLTLEDWGGAEGQSGESVVEETISAAMQHKERTPMTEAEVKVKLDALARRLEAERIKSGLLDSPPQAKSREYDLEAEEVLGRKLAEIG